MLNIHHDESRPSRVTVAFEGGALSFMLSKDATFKDLADRLDRLGERHHGKPVINSPLRSTPNDADSSRDLVSVVVSASPHTRTPNTNIGRPVSVI
jgi:hypothetical protein